MTAPRRVRVVVADDHPLMVEAVVARLEAEPGIEVVGSAGRADELVAACTRLDPDVVVADLSMPGGGGIRALEGIRAAGCRARVLFLSTVDDPASIWEAVASGAAGYLHKGGCTSELASRVLSVASGQRVFDAVAAAGLAAAVQAEAMAPPRLSERELAVLVLVAEGRTNPEIAVAVNLAASTVKTYLDRVFTKLGVRDRAAAVAVAKDRRLL
ncbi:MAG: response regulator transcription factor [Acidimicrobiales bacterium]